MLSYEIDHVKLIMSWFQMRSGRDGVFRISFEKSEIPASNVKRDLPSVDQRKRGWKVEADVSEISTQTEINFARATPDKPFKIITCIFSKVL